nr:FG-GAP-like repeat-containing protein [Polyangiaceae bacterium]
PSDGSARSVANHWGVHASGSGAPANCFTPGGCYAAPVPGAEAREYQDMPQGTVGYAEAVALRDAKVVTGCKTTPPLFCPKCSLTRAEAVRFILRAGKVDVSNPPTTASFSDVATDSADYAYVETAKALGMTNGCGSGKFCPGDPLTRAAFARMLRVGADFLESDPATPTYSDVPRDHANYGDIETLVRRCAAEPCASGQFCPTATVERGEAAAMIARAFEIKAKSGCSPDPLEEELIASDDPGQMTDIDADGRTDVCMRTATGYDCHLSSGGVFATPLAGPAFSDSSGWADPSNYSTLRMNDFDGDGRADICARANKGIVCWYSDADGFSAGVDGPEWSDALGFNKNQYFTTLRSGDVNGDGRADLCIRTSTDFRCHLSTGRSFGDARIGPDFSDAAGFDHAARYGSIRLGDINGDKRDDVCALDGTALKCFVATDDGFGPPLTGPAWSDDDGFDQGARVLTLQLVDVDGDERADACIRTDTDFRCHLSTGTAFDDAHIGPALSDASGWSKYRYATTLRLADIDGDGDRDLCARAAAGMRCYPWESGTFGSAIVGPELSDAKGWGRERYFRTLRLSDVDGDGRADLCARAAKGLMCLPGTETGFSANPEDGPEWSDALGLWRVRYFSTLALSAPKRSGVPGPGGWGGGGNITPGGAGAGNASEDASEGGCGCRLSRSADDYGLLVALGFSLLLAARRRPTRRRRRFGS